MRFVKIGHLVFNASRHQSAHSLRIGKAGKWFARPLFWRFWWANR